MAPSSARRLLWLSDALLLAVAAVWGTSYGAKTALAFYPVLGLLALRFGLTFVLLLLALRGLRGVPGPRCVGRSAGWASCCSRSSWVK